MALLAPDQRTFLALAANLELSLLAFRANFHFSEVEALQAFLIATTNTRTLCFLQMRKASTLPIFQMKLRVPAFALASPQDFSFSTLDALLL